jgi:predicted RND superfamily exporter protein
MTEKESNAYIDRNVRKYVIFIDSIKVLKQLANPSTNKIIIKIQNITDIYYRRKYVLELIKMIQVVHEMYKLMNKTDEDILNIKRKQIMNIINKIISDYIKEDFKTYNCRYSIANYLYDNGLLINQYAVRKRRPRKNKNI